MDSKFTKQVLPKDQSESDPSAIDPPHQEVDVDVLKELWRKGRDAWKDVPDGTAWVEKLRGH